MSQEYVAPTKCSSCHSRLVPLRARQLNWVSTLHSVGEFSFPYAKNLSNVFDPELEHVSYTFDNINFGSMIVCGLPASPHDLVHESDAGRGLLRVLR